MKLCSACLMGICCRYDGKSKPNKKIITLLKEETLIPVCPEQLGGLPIPRAPSEIKGGKVYSKDGIDVTDSFKKGAHETLKVAKLFNIKNAIFKQKSPSCGCGKIYDGTFSGKVINGDGITTLMMKQNGISVISEDDI